MSDVSVVGNLDDERLRRLRLGGRAASRRRLVLIGRAQAQHLPNRRNPVSANPPSRNPCLAGRLTLLPGELRRELHAFHCTQRGRQEPTIMMRASTTRSEEHTSELQSRLHLVCRLLLEKKKK